MKTVIKFLSIMVIFSLNVCANEKVTLQLSWLHQFQFAGYYMAKELGFYRDVGIDLEIKEFKYGLDVSSVIEEDVADFAIGRSSLLIDKFNGKDVVALGAIFQNSPLMLLVTKESNINTIKDLKNKNVMITSDAQGTASISAMLTSKGISFDDITIQKHSFNLQDLISGKTDAMASYISNEPIKLSEKNIEYKIFHPKNYGFRFYDDILFTSSSYISQNPQRTKDFYEATIKGWEYAFTHIGETSEVIFRDYNSQNKSKIQLVKEGEALKELAYDSKDKEIGYLDKDLLEKIVDIYKVMGYINKDINLDEFIYKENNHHVYEIKLTKVEIVYITVISALAGLILIMLTLYISSKNKWFLTQKDLEKEVEKGRKELAIKKEYIEYQYATLDSIINSSNAFISIKDENLNYVLCNNCFLGFLNKKREEIIGKNNQDIFNKNLAKQLDKIDNEIISNNKEQSRTVWMTSDYDDKKILVHSFAQPFEYEKGKKGVLIYAMDITEQKRIEDERLKNQTLMLRQNKILALSTLLNNMAHQWRQPLCGASMSISSIKLAYELEHEINQEELIQNIDSALSQMQYLSTTLDNLSQFLNFDKSHFNNTNIKKIFEEFIALIGVRLENKGIKTYCEIDSIQCNTNASLLIQSLVNIIENSMDAFENKAIINENRVIFISARKEKDAMVIKIKDSAGGIDKEIYHQIFEPYSTTKHQSVGIGLSLYITYHIIVEQFEGSIYAENVNYTIENKDVSGVEFTLTIPTNSQNITNDI